MNSIKKILVSVSLIFCFFSIAFCQIQLSIPDNSDTLFESEPNLIWQTYSSFLNDPRYSLTLTLVEMEEEQLTSEAIIENVPVLFRENLLQNSYTLTSSEIILKKNVWYAWQVNLLFFNVPTQQSEIWKFILVDPKPPITNCIALRRTVDNSVYFLDSQELMLSTDEVAIKNFSASIFNSENQVTEVQLIEGESNQSSDLKHYKLNIKDLNLEKGFYRFEWKPNNQVNFVLNIEI